jgi:hypothetical protein
LKGISRVAEGRIELVQWLIEVLVQDDAVATWPARRGLLDRDKDRDGLAGPGDDDPLSRRDPSEQPRQVCLRFVDIDSHTAEDDLVLGLSQLASQQWADAT